jgi:hypothetical protein
MLPVIERGYVPVVFATNVVRVDRYGDNLLMVFGFETVDEAGQPVMEIVAKILRPVSSMLETQRLVDMAVRVEPPKPSPN